MEVRVVESNDWQARRAHRAALGARVEEMYMQNERSTVSKKNPMLSMEDLHGEERLAQRELLADRIEEFYNRAHAPSGPQGGQFVEGPDGPGRKRDPGTEDLGKKGNNAKKAAAADEASDAKEDGKEEKPGWLARRKAKAEKKKADEKAAKKAAYEAKGPNGEKSMSELMAEHQAKADQADADRRSSKPADGTEKLPELTEAEKADQKKRGWTYE